MNKFEKFNEEERQAIITGLVKECNNYVEYGVNGLNDKGKGKYNIALSLLKEADVNKEYEYIYKNWAYA
jgi:hypothetical protein